MERQRKIIFGYDQLKEKKSFQGIDSEFTHVKSIAVERTRALGEKIDLDDQDGDIVEMIFDDNTVWIGNVDDVDEIYGRKRAASRSGGGEYEFGSHVGGVDSRGGRKGGFLRIFNLFRPKKKAAKIAAAKLVEQIDRKLSEEEILLEVSKDFDLAPAELSESGDEPYLLLLHGTISNTEESFHGLSNEGNKPWPGIHANYSGKVLAYDHFTLSKSVLENALDLLRRLPGGIVLDIMSGSRGGLIADILARCDRRNEVIGFSSEEVERMKDEFDEGEQAELMQTLSDVAKDKGIEIGRVMRVACPGSGTTLLSRRVDHFLNALLSSIGIAAGIGVSPAFQAVRSLLLEIVRQRYDAEVIPGLWSMVPASPFQLILNSPDSLVASDLYVVEGDAKFGGKFGYSLLVILTNLFYWKDNDFVIETHRMRHGANRVNGVYLFTSRDKSTHHLNYFKKANSQEAITVGLSRTEASSRLFEKVVVSYEDRGVALGLIEFKSLDVDTVSGNRPVVVLLPGIMGSFIYSEDDLVWVDLQEIHKGRLVDDLNYNANGVEAKSLIAKYYKKLADHLLKTHDVVTLPFDWRSSLTEASAKLSLVLDALKGHEKPVRILAHSMGGLVVRQYMMDHPDEWSGFIDRPGSRFVMLGTPWLGSYLILQVLTGHSRKVKLLSFLDRKHKKIELLEMLCEYRGVFELLPIDDRKLETLTFWRELKRQGKINMHIPSKEVLAEFADFKSKVNEEAGKLDMKNVIYVAGKHDKTVFDYEIRRRYFRDDIVFLATPEGDGSVTWESGIPQNIDKDNLYFANTTHTQLSNDKDIFDGIVELLEQGRTSAIPQTRPKKRGGEEVMELYEDYEPVFNTEEAIAAFYEEDSPVLSSYDDVESIEVSVTNADLRMASYPVLVGHFKDDGIVSAEGIIDSRLDYRLSRMHTLGKYPGAVGESVVFLEPESNPSGAIIAGLGLIGELTTFNLKVTVEHAVLRYMQFVRDNMCKSDSRKTAEGISALLVGSGFGNLSISESVRGIMLGVASANLRVKQLGYDLIPIRKVEFLEIYEEKAATAFMALMRSSRLDQRVSYTLNPKLEKSYGHRKQDASADDGSWWWHRLSTIAIEDDEQKQVIGLEFNSSSGIARVKRQAVMIPSSQIEILVAQLADSSSWSPEKAKTLFELLIPNDFKEVLRSQHNIIWQMDTHVAQWPWELLYDITTDNEPSFVNSGMIRRLLVDEYRQTPGRAPADTALIVGDPVYNIPALPQLEGALQEAKKVHRILKGAGFDCNPQFNANTVDILSALYAREYQVLHFAGHGVYDPGGMGIGIAMGNGHLLTPAHIEQLPYVPDFVFVNCCLSGRIDKADDVYTTNRYKLAANIGKQLIMIGVKAVIVTGWEVNDQAAFKFAETFYNLMWQGCTFGDAVTKARKVCFQHDATSSTWAAYQCYGDQFFKFKRDGGGGFDWQPYVLKSELERDLDNLYSEVAYSPDLDVGRAREKLKSILGRAGDHVDGGIYERQAMICAELNLLKEAVAAYERMLDFEYAGFTVKAIEQYCLCRLKLLLNKYDDGHALTEEDRNSYDTVIGDLNCLISIGETGERHALVGSAYKFGSRLFEGEEKLEQLKLSREAYERAYLRDQAIGGDNSFYYLTNYITVSYLIDGKDKKAFNKEVVELLDVDINTFLETRIDEALARSKGSDNFYDRLALVNYELVAMLTGPDAGVKQAKARLVGHYEDAFELTSSKKKRRTEVDHLRFIVNSGRISEEKAEAMKDLIIDLERM